MTDPYPPTAPYAGTPGRDHTVGPKATYLTTEFIVYIATVLAVLLTALVVQDTDDHGDYFRADRAFLYVTILSVGYMLSRGLAKTGGRGSHDHH